MNAQQEHVISPRSLPYSTVARSSPCTRESLCMFCAVSNNNKKPRMRSRISLQGNRFLEWPESAMARDECSFLEGRPVACRQHHSTTWPLPTPLWPRTQPQLYVHTSAQCWHPVFHLPTPAYSHTLNCQPPVSFLRNQWAIEYGEVSRGIQELREGGDTLDNLSKL